MRKAPPTLQSFALLLILGCLAAGCAGSGRTPVRASDPQRIIGSYHASFTTRSGSSSEGTLKISPLGNLLYWLEWRDAKSHYSGRGALVGEALLAVWGTTESQCLAAMLDLEQDGVLRGIWFRAEDRNGATGTLEANPSGRVESKDFAGIYAVVADGPGSENLPRELRVAALGDGLYRFNWSGDKALEGRGRLSDGSILVVSSVVGSGDLCRISEMILAADGSLSWKWLTHGQVKPAW